MHYLHKQSPPIVLGCFTSKNILLATDNVAKISDFGVSRAINPDLLEHCKFLLSRQHSITHIAPEVYVQTSTKLSEDNIKKFDAFSFGNVILNVFTHQFPTSFFAFDSSSHTQNEIEARQYLIDRIGVPSVKSLAIECLDNEPKARPTFMAIVNCFDTLQSRTTCSSLTRKPVSESIEKILFSEISTLEATIAQTELNWKKLYNFQAIISQVAKLAQQLRDKRECLVDKIIEELSVKNEIDNHEIEKFIKNSNVIQRLLNWIILKKGEIEKIQKILCRFSGEYEYNDMQACQIKVRYMVGDHKTFYRPKAKLGPSLETHP